ncbi:peptidase U32 family protein [Paenibacillus sp. IITD108]|uniref:peptidase U32 family protein n=1 Tax=Paenibacillus sp. IITD108 TaxID=3116649 RepID=UPI002F41CA45
MTYKPELLCTAASLDEMKVLIEAGADAFVVGEARFGMRLAGEFSIGQMQEAAELAKKHRVKIYAALNNVIDNAALPLLDDYILALQRMQIDGVVFGDPAVLMAVRRMAPDLKLHWNAEMTSTNYSTANYWGKRGASRFVLARELNMEQIVEMKDHTDLEIQVQVHGMTNIYHSKRQLVQSYLDHHNNSDRLPSKAMEQGLYLTESERPGETYPIYEDINGTHIMSSDDICMLENLHELLDAKIDSFKVEGIMKSTAYNEAVVKAYRQVIDLYIASPEAYKFQEEWLEPIKALQDEKRELSFGFFFKEQVY